MFWDIMCSFSLIGSTAWFTVNFKSFTIYSPPPSTTSRTLSFMAVEHLTRSSGCRSLNLVGRSLSLTSSGSRGQSTEA
uniref:Uncharacterized protein n=1 Tax=Arundo donax TaxID=35708 RepID=A0A0A9DUS4_ARUDO